MTSKLDPDFEQRLNEVADRITVALDQLIPPASGPEAQLMRAMRHGALSKGKRLRPFITIECGRMFGAQEKSLLRGAALLASAAETPANTARDPSAGAPTASALLRGLPSGQQRARPIGRARLGDRERFEPSRPSRHVRRHTGVARPV